jgi:predicted DCC family thiol-disulfide oxidoreductase YuxK
MDLPREDWKPRAVEGVPDGLIVFDGVCVFCSSWVRFVIARDPAMRFRFTPVQSVYGSALAAQLGISVEAPETNAVVFADRAYFKSDAALEVLSRLPGWRWMRALRCTPRLLRDGLYDWIARRRYRLFGRHDSCMVPTPELSRRFLFDQPAAAAR